MNWMLVLFMGVSPHYNIVKTDLIFGTEIACFAHEKTMVQKHAEKVNRYLKDWKEGRDNTFTDAAVKWSQMQFPVGTCIPTTSKITVN